MAKQTVALDFTILTAAQAPSAPSSGYARVYVGMMANKPTVVLRGPTGRVAPLQNFLGRMRVSWAQALGDSTSIGVFGITIAATGTATTAATTPGSTFYVSLRRIDYLVTVASTSAVAGFRYNQAQFYRGDAAGRGGFMFCCRWGAATGVATSTTRGFCGMTSVTGAPTDVDPSSLNNILGFGWDNGDANFSFMHRTGSGTVVKDTLSTTIPKPSVNNTSVYECTIYCAPNDTVVYYEITNLTTGDTASGSVNSSLPAQDTLLCPKCYMSVGGTSSVIGVSLMSMYLETET